MKNQDELLESFKEFIKIPSISTDPKYAQDVVKAASWVKNHLEKSGLQTSIWESSAHPVIFGEKISDPQAPILLIYHHYDVQPSDPLEEWESPPFEPSLRNGKIYARGASDNKGQAFYTLTALRDFLKNNPDPQLNIKVLIEGNEETGSEGLEELLPQKKSALKADYLLIVDSSLITLDQPIVTLGVRGIATVEIECIGSEIDLHSGLYGGLAYNPNRALAELLAKCWDEEGHVAIPHFYDDVEKVSPQVKEMLASSCDFEALKREGGIRANYIEEGIEDVEANWLRPTIEINGMSGGYTGEGLKTVIPAKASAKISARLVPHQDPEKISSLIAEFLKKNAPPGIEIKCAIGHGGSGIRGSSDSPFVKKLMEAMSDVWKKPCGLALLGGSVPITTELSRASGAEILFIGTALPGDLIHAPNEHFSLKQLELGYMMMYRILERLST